jgi:acyl-CoA thioester hydrolase
VADLIQTYRGTVMQWQLDHMGHMNVMWYVGKFDEATWNLFAMFGVTAKYLRESGRAMAAVDQRLQYRSELVAGDTVVINSGVLEIREKVFRFFHEMRNAETNEISATCRLIGVHMDATARKATPFPPQIIERGRGFLREYDFAYRD